MATGTISEVAKDRSITAETVRTETISDAEVAGELLQNTIEET